MTPLQDLTFHDVKQLFDAAEGALKIAEHSRVKLLLPAVNELRYAGRHVIEAMAAGDDNDKQQRELGKAAKHCKRALYDVYEAEVLFLFDSYDAFKKGYELVVITQVIPNYIEIHRIILAAMRSYRESSPAERDNREQFAEHAAAIRDKISPLMESLECARDELNKLVLAKQQVELEKAKQDRLAAIERRRSAWIATIAAIAAIVSAIVGIAAVLR